MKIQDLLLFLQHETTRNPLQNFASKEKTKLRSFFEFGLVCYY